MVAPNGSGFVKWVLCVVKTGPRSNWCPALAGSQDSCWVGFCYSVNPHEQQWWQLISACKHCPAFPAKPLRVCSNLIPVWPGLALAAVLPHLGVKWPRGVTLSTCLGWLWRHFGCKDSARAGTQTLESRGSGAQQLFVCVNLDSCARTSPGEVMTLRSGGDCAIPSEAVCNAFPWASLSWVEKALAVISAAGLGVLLSPCSCCYSLKPFFLFWGRGSRLAQVVQVCTGDSKSLWNEGRCFVQITSVAFFCELTGVQEKWIWRVEEFLSPLWMEKVFPGAGILIFYSTTNRVEDMHEHLFLFQLFLFLKLSWQPSELLNEVHLWCWYENRFCSWKTLILPGKESWTGLSSHNPVKIWFPALLLKMSWSSLTWQQCPSLLLHVTAGHILQHILPWV